MTIGAFIRLVIVTPLAIVFTAALFLVIYSNLTPDPLIYRKAEEPGRVYLKLNNEEERFICDCGWLPAPRQPNTTNQYTDPQKVVTAPPTVPEEKVTYPKVEIFGGENDSPRYCDGGHERNPLISVPGPQYPEACIAKGAEGRVIVEIDIDADGNVSNVEIIESDDQCFNEEVLSYVKRWKFRPVCDVVGQPYSRSDFQQTITFEIVE
jgi:TonB family protein